MRPALTLPAAVATLARVSGEPPWSVWGESIAGPADWARVTTLLPYAELRALGRELAHSDLVLRRTPGGQAHHEALLANPPPARPEERAARLAAWSAELVAFLDDPKLLAPILAALDQLPRVVAEALLRTAYVITVGHSAIAWTGGSSFPLTRWPVVIGPTPDLLRVLRHEAAHVFYDRHPAGPLLSVDPIALARTLVETAAEPVPADVRAWRDEAEARARACETLWGLDA